MLHAPVVLALGDRRPRIHETVYLAPGAVVAGDVDLAPRVSVWFSTVVRAEAASIHVGSHTNLQDGTIVHADPDFPTTVGKRVTVGHRAVLHGCTVEDDVLVGMGAVILNGANIGRGAVVGAGAVVMEGTQVPPMSLAVGVPARVLDRPVPEIPRSNVESYLGLAGVYRAATEL